MTRRSVTWRLAFSVAADQRPGADPQSFCLAAGNRIPTLLPTGYDRGMDNDQFGPCDYQAVAVRLRLMFYGSILPDAFRHDLDSFLSDPCSRTALPLMRHDNQIYGLFTNTIEGRRHRRAGAKKLLAKRRAERTAPRAFSPPASPPEKSESS
jgi:hypothetical protein